MPEPPRDGLAGGVALREKLVAVSMHINGKDPFAFLLLAFPNLRHTNNSTNQSATRR
jgi:hypothetical protein